MLNTDNLQGELASIIQSMAPPIGDEKKEEMFSFDLTKSSCNPLQPPEVDMKFVMQVIQPAVKKLKKFIDYIKEAPTSFELESRLIGMGDSQYDQILSFLTRNIAAFKFTPCIYTEDLYFDGDIRFRKTWQRKIVNKDGVNSIVMTKPEEIWTKKKLMENIDWNIDGRPLAMRISMKQDKIIPPLTTLPVPTHYQNKTSALFENGGIQIYASTIWAGKTQHEMKWCIPEKSIETELKNEYIVQCQDSDEPISNLLYHTLLLQGLHAPLSISEIRY